MEHTLSVSERHSKKRGPHSCVGVGGGGALPVLSLGMVIVNCSGSYTKGIILLHMAVTSQAGHAK